MSSMKIKLHGAVLILLSILAWAQFQQVQDFDKGASQQIYKNLERIIRLDAITEEEMLLLQTNHSQNYDLLTQKSKELEQTFARLVEQLSGQLSLQQPLQILQQSIQVQLSAVNAFKANFGIVRNSRRFFPMMIDVLIQEQPEFKYVLMHLNRNVFQYILEPNNQDLSESILNQYAELKGAGTQQVRSHIDALLKYAPLMQDNIEAVIYCGTPKNVYRVTDVYNALHHNVMEKFSNSRYWLIGLIVFLLLYLSALLYSLVGSTRLLRDANGKLITAQKQLKEDLQKRKEAEQRFRTLVDASSAAIMTHSNQHFISANPAALKMFGIANEEAAFQLNAADLSPTVQEDGQDSISAARAYRDLAMQTGSCAFEWQHQRSNGDVFPAYVQLTAMQLDDKKVLQAVVTDMSDLHKSKEEKNRLVAALNASAEAVVITDTESRMLYVNSSFERLTGYCMDEVEGKFISMLRCESVGISVYENMSHTVNTGHTWRGEVPIQPKDGQEILTDRSIAPIYNASGVVGSHVAILRDIGEIKERAKKLEHTQRLESLGILAGGIAHDFNNILTAIMGNASMAARTLDDTSPAKEKLANIETATHRAAELCKQMLAYSGKGKFVVKVVDLSHQVEEMMRLMEVSISTNVVVKYHLAANLPTVKVDVAQMQQVILNLITNANEAIGERSGVISLTTGVMHADRIYLEHTVSTETLLEGRYAYIEVSDTGCGMDKDTIEKVFDPFFTTKFTGRGLGMSAVLGIVRGHHGTMSVYSELDKGTTFKVLFPVSDQKCVPEQHEVSNDDWVARGTVLIVDDEETIREVASMMLEDLGFSTLTAVDGLDAVDIYREHQAEIVGVILDMTMPKMDGASCYRELCRINKDVKVVLSSGYTEEDVTDQFNGKGLAGFIQKPYTPEPLAAVIKKAF